MHLKLKTSLVAAQVLHQPKYLRFLFYKNLSWLSMQPSKQKISQEAVLL